MLRLTLGLSVPVVCQCGGANARVVSRVLWFVDLVGMGILRLCD
jgi:hypothetical protein